MLEFVESLMYVNFQCGADMWRWRILKKALPAIVMQFGWTLAITMPGKLVFMLCGGNIYMAIRQQGFVSNCNALPNCRYGLGTIYFRQEKYKLAEFHFRRALHINSRSSVLHCYLGMALHTLKVRFLSFFSCISVGCSEAVSLSSRLGSYLVSSTFHLFCNAIQMC